jgi:phage tail-like protein
MYHLPVGFHFKVNIEGTGDGDMRFQNVSGLSAEIDTETVAEGGENRFSHRLPKPVKYSNLILKRGMMVGSGLIGWFQDAVENFQFSPRTITVQLLGPPEGTGKEAMVLEQWVFTNAWPVKWQISDFDATQNQLVIETIEFAFQYFTRSEVKKTPLPFDKFDKGNGAQTQSSLT